MRTPLCIVLRLFDPIARIRWNLFFFYTIDVGRFAYSSGGLIVIASCTYDCTYLVNIYYYYILVIYVRPCRRRQVLPQLKMDRGGLLGS